MKHLNYAEYQELAHAVDYLRITAVNACEVSQRFVHVIKAESDEEKELVRLTTRAEKVCHGIADIVEELSDDMGDMLVTAKEVCK